MTGESERAFGTGSREPPNLTDDFVYSKAVDSGGYCSGNSSLVGRTTVITSINSNPNLFIFIIHTRVSRETSSVLWTTWYRL